MPISTEHKITTNEIESGYKKIISSQLQYSDRLNKASALWLFIGTISLHDSKDGWFKLFGSILLLIIFFYDVFYDGWYRLKDARNELKILDGISSKFHLGNNNLLDLHKKAHSELATLLPIKRAWLYFFCSAFYFGFLFREQFIWLIEFLFKP